jgi:ubiquinone/menaquinone biosynthesis C-methylase UbiE
VRAHVGSMTAMPFADHSFDAVLAISVLHHVDLKEAAVQELRRVLRPRGLFSVSLTLAHCSACTTDQGMCARASVRVQVCVCARESEDLFGCLAG